MGIMHRVVGGRFKLEGKSGFIFKAEGYALYHWP